MQFWRICRQRYAAAAATGEGARRYGGRWNSPGTSLVYASTSLALAAVETFVNLEPNLRPDDLVSIAGKIADSLPIEKLEVTSLPARWNTLRDESLRPFDDNWVRSASSVALWVPSAAIPGEWNLLLNPAHPDFAQLRFEAPQPFDFDLRMFR